MNSLTTEEDRGQHLITHLQKQEKYLCQNGNAVLHTKFDFGCCGKFVAI